MKLGPIAYTSRLDPRIDRLRGLFAIAVAMGHAIDVVRLNSPVDMASHLFASWRFFFGFTWVVGFIVLSGYCIARSTSSTTQPYSVAKYSLMRVTRIFPLLIVCGLVAALVEYSMFGSTERPAVWVDGIDRHHLRISLLGLSGFYGQFGSYAPSYTVSYELLYYALWGVVLIPLSAKPRLALLACAGIALLLYVASPSLHQHLAPAVRPLTSQWVLMLFGAWLIGAGVSLFEQSLVSIVRGLPVALAWVFFVLFNIAAARYTGHPIFGASTGSAVAYYLALAATFCVVILAYLASQSTAGSSSLDRWLGEISYPVFLIHGPVLILVGYVVNRLEVKVHFLLNFLLSIACALLAAHLLVLFVERPVMELRRRLSVWRPARDKEVGFASETFDRQRPKDATGTQ